MKNNETIEKHLPESLEFVKAVCRNTLPRDEQMSIAGNALMRVIETWDGARGDFMRYAKPFLRGAVKQAWRDKEVVSYGDETPDKPDPLNPPEPLEPAEDFFDFDDMTTRERIALLRPYLQRLTEPERRTLVLVYEGGFSFQEIGDMFAVTRSAIQRTHGEALKQLRNWLMEEQTARGKSMWEALK
jgi:RNA polymerase sigma factor (sigma-70 family)